MMDPLESCVPPGFRFHPTEEELVDYYLKRKISSLKIDLDVIVELDLYKMEPWDIQERCNLGYYEQNEWYFFSHKDKKYPTGTRTNRATVAGFWKATGRDKAVLSKNRLIGMRKTLVFYKGRAPNGRKSDWIMHEYRLQTSEHGPPQEEGWVVCRAFKKPTPNHRQGFEAWNHARDNTSRPFSDTISNPSSGLYTNQGSMYHHHQVLDSNSNQSEPFLENLELPQLDSPTMSTREGLHQSEDYNEDERSNHSYVDWKNMDCLLSSQTSHQNLDGFEAQNNVSYLLGCFPDS